ncbi:MAG: ATP-binding cassette domain-containing protein [Verrucomicrobia bacterium]|nr:ATP-binding cassette domain-containing protein [Verrucomicrobiota bacterium]MBI3867335.1 ATP-binding cassette domain-containing protein [Verrucomicrobiota bacterium]
MESNTAILSAQDLELRHNDRVILNRASLAITENERLGLLGRNGSGKTTFLRIIAEEVHVDAGTVTRQRGLVVGYLPQEFTLDPSRNVRDNIQAGAAHVLELIREFEALPGDSPRHAQLEERIEHFDGWNLDHRISLAMDQLGCPASDRDIATLSGGEKRRVALARAIVARPDLLILDEPTNHLDTESIEWIVEYLADYPGALLVVTHDRHFLDRVATGIVELRNGVFERYEGNYTDYLVTRAEKLATEELVEHKRQMFLRREVQWVRTQPKARTTKSKSRLERFDAVADQGPPPDESDMDLVIPPAPQLGNRVVDLEDLGVRLGDRWLFSHLNYHFEAGGRIGITGRNGLGKTTLLRALIGQLPPTAGEVRVGSLTQFNYVDQGRLQLRDEKTVLEEVSDGSEWVRWGDSRLSLRGYLKRFLFTDDRIVTQVKHLSGGERSRLLLARILKQGGNFLILDEPTNDLDLATMRVLEEALLAFTGSVVVVSHDRYFLNRICTGVLAFEGDGAVRATVGNYDRYLEQRKRQAAASAERSQAERTSARATATPAASGASPSGRRRKLSFKEQQELDGIEARIHEAEAEVRRIEALFASPNFHRDHGPRTLELTEQLAALRARVPVLFARWEELEAIKAQVG